MLTRPVSPASSGGSAVSAPAPAGGHLRRWPILYALCIALLVMSSSVMAVTNALPAIALELRATTAQLQWITETTILALASLLITMGALADRHGRRRVLLAGLAVFAAASLLAAASRNPGELIAARALLGVGNAVAVTGAIETAARLGGQSGDALAALARDAFVAGFADAALIAAGLALTVAFLTTAFLTDPHHRDLEEKLG
ncbi:MFS transporter [Nonomuraea sp. B12E4]|uniref:MFS transporter n=1 Tax=Nonomuraea sp. B12E4 TaxID=3153564 RepID=UPI00325D7F00